MPTSFDTFERYKQRGLDARRAGQWESAKIYLLEAARAMLDLSKSADSQPLVQSRRDTAQRLLELAKDCDAARQARRPASQARRTATAAGNNESAEPATSAEQWVVKERPTVGFDDVAGLSDVKEEIRLKMILPFAHPELAEKFGVRGGGGVLLYGPPGTGKTLLARATAGELDATFYTVSAADLLSKWVGEAEQNIKKLFDAAAGEERAVIFIDEIEALVPARRDDGGSVMQRVVPQILQGMEGFGGRGKSAVLFLGATNVPWQLDPAVLRPGRFDQKVYVPLPDAPARVRLLELYLKNRPLADAVDLDALAARLGGYSGADIKYVCDRAAVIPFLKSVAGEATAEITPKILDDVLADAQPSVSADAVTRFGQWAAEH
ncbi:MAG TPA: ATP-binding protein [Tepidisphaeraceae bacterium]|jgi:transitional endoplasmic reticulum ATPase